MTKFLQSVVALLFLVLFASCSEKEEQTEQQRPNILFCISDDQSFPHAGAYGCDWVKTPAFDRVAREGILFTNAYTCNAKCAPSRSSIVTGRNSWQLEEAANHWPYFPAKFKTYAEVLMENDYFVGHTAKGWAPGVALDSNGVKRQLTGPAFNEFKTEPPTGHINGNDYARNFEAFLDANEEGKPFCFWYGGLEPHRSYEFKSGAEKGGKEPSEIDKVLEFWPDDDTVRHDMLDYAFEIEYFDQHLAKMLALLEERGMLENTLVVVTSDNGMPFPRVKGNSYEYSNHMPLAMMWKNGIKNPGRKMEDYVSFADFAPTFLDLAGVDAETSGMQPMEGNSLQPVLKNEEDVNKREFMVIGKERTDVGRPDDVGYPIRGIVRDGWMYIHNYKSDRWPAGNPVTGYLDTDGSPTKTTILNHRRRNGESKYWDWNFGKRPAEELYHIAVDPDCIDNLAENQEHEELKKELENLLVEELKAEGDPRMFGKGHIFDEYLYSNKSDRDFYNRMMRGEEVRAGWVEPSDFEKEPIEE
ncbi:MAG: sulfatase [Prolixibacteraceae bacterium]